MIFLLYTLLREIQFESRDPDTKARYGVCALGLNVFIQVVAAILHLLVAAVALDVVVGDLVPSDAKCCLAEYMIKGLLVIVPGISMLILGLIRSGLMVEI